MTTRLLIMFFGVALFLCALCGAPAHAQMLSCTAPVYCSWYSLWFGGCQPALPPNAYDCAYGGPWTRVCLVQTNSCPPPPCPTCGSSNGGGPINFDTGNTYVTDSDLKIPGLSSGLQLSRTWNSIWAPRDPATSVGLFGPNWKSTYEERIYVGSDNYLKYMRGDGSVQSFGWAGNYMFTRVTPIDASTKLQLSGVYSLALRNGETRFFDPVSGSLTSIVDRNGNTTQLTYDSLNRLVTVADPGGRHLYFGYGSNSSYLVTSVTSDVGISLSYSYDSSGRLIQVTKPDQSTISYAYDPNSMISAIRDSNGVILESHTYDSCGRGLTSARASGVEALTLTYDQPCWQSAPQQYLYYGN